METKIIAAESAHFYDRAGSPMYEVQSRNGLMRPTTLADARKLDLVPSTTKVIGDTARRPGLERYWEDQLLDSALTLQIIEGELADQRKQRIREDAKEHSRKAAERGTELHKAIENYIQGNGDLVPDQFAAHVSKLDETLGQYGIDLWKGKAEHSFASSSFGYGGKIDWHNDHILIDFKIKDEIKNVKKLAWPEHCWQLAAYDIGIGGYSLWNHRRLINVFIGVDDCEVRIHEWEPEDAKKGWNIFEHLLAFWRLKNDYNP